MKNYTRKTDRGAPRDILMRAAQEVLRNNKSKAAAAKDFNVDRMTLSRFIKKIQQSEDAITGYKAVAAAKTIIPETMEKDLAIHLVTLCDIFHGLSQKSCRVLAFEFCSRNNVNMPRSWSEHGLAGQDWWLKFAERHQLTLRAPESTSLARASAFNKPVVNKFFSNLAKVMDEHKFSPNQIFNCDETGLTTVQKPKAAVAKRGTKQVGSITSQERGELVTVMYAVSASGNSIPPMMIIPRVNYRDHFIRGAPPGTIGCANPSGWMTKGLFINFLDHLIQQTNCSVDRKVLLVMDNHETHMSFIMLTIPPHTSHRLQPLVRTVYGPLKTAYNIAMDSWMRSNPGKNVTIYDIPELLRIAHNEALTPKNMSSGFACTGIFPFNQTVFSDTDFAPSATTDNIVTVSGAADDGRGEEEPGPSVSVRHNEQGPSDRRDEPGPSPRPYVSPADIRPFPKAIKPAKPTQRGRKKRSTTILTSSPARAALFHESEIKKCKVGQTQKGG